MVFPLLYRRGMLYYFSLDILRKTIQRGVMFKTLQKKKFNS